jgi:sulfur-oxidizing protein SoxZ
MASAIINMKRTAAASEVLLIKALVAHPMETGLRPGADGKVLPTDLIRTFTCTFETAEKKSTVFSANLYAAIAANPYISFYFKASKSGKLTFTWVGDNGFNQSENVSLTVA